jgi:5'-nucleotidase
MVETPGHLPVLAEVADGFVSVTPLHLDLTHDESLLPLGRQLGV